MNFQTSHRVCAAAFLLLATSATQAGYRCDPPTNPIDRRACEAAQQSPEALRRFVQRMKPVQSLDFHDYVNEQTRLAWDAREQAEQAARAVARRQP